MQKPFCLMKLGGGNDHRDQLVIFHLPLLLGTLEVTLSRVI